MPANGHQRADVELRLPADSAYVSVLRTTTAGLAARLDFPIDDIEDLRIAVGEASAMVLPEADAESDLVCRFFMTPGFSGHITPLRTFISTRSGFCFHSHDSTSSPRIASDGTLATSAEAATAEGRFSVSLTMEPEPSGAGL